MTAILTVASAPQQRDDPPSRLHLHPLLRVVGHRLLVAVPLVLLVSGLTFVLLSLTPGDAALQILGNRATPEALAALRQSLGLDLPLYEQFARWLQRAVRGDLGTSVINGEPVMTAVRSRAPVTLSLMAGAIVLSVVFGVTLGVLSAVRSGPLGRAIDVLALLGWALPVFWVGPQLVVLFAVKLQWLPAVGYVPIAESPSDWLRSLILPVCALSLGSVAAVAKQTREAMLDVLSSEYIRLARANGIRRRSLIYRHALKNAAIRVVTVLGVQAIGLLGGALFIESVFSLPGLGSLVVSASLAHDIPVVLGVAIAFTIVVIAVNVLVDVAYQFLNPKLRAS